ncbi:histone deacetylase and transcriptional regulator, partial [Mucor velutinosus]
AKDLAIEKLQGQLSSRRTNQGAQSSSQVTPTQELVTIHQPDATQGSYASAARKGAQHRDPARTTKRRLAAGRRSGKILRSEVRYQLRRAGIDTGRVLDICFPATGVIGILLHIQYVEEFLACMRKCEADHIENFQPLDPNNIADPIPIC